MDIDPLDDGMPKCPRWHFTDMMFYSITIYTFDYPEMPFFSKGGSARLGTFTFWLSHILDVIYVSL
jgi:hypothetical protein